MGCGGSKQIKVLELRFYNLKSFDDIEEFDVFFDKPKQILEE
jgi:hypothetical protein